MASKRPAPKASPDGLVVQMRERLEDWLKIAGSATELSWALAQARVRQPAKRAALARAGAMIKQWRQSAGMTAQEVATALGLGDAGLLELAEGGRAALPVELTLRLVGVLGRHDPLTAAMDLTRQSNPDLWRALEGLGLGKLVLQSGRERALSNLYRGSDAARGLDDEQFKQVLTFTQQAFDLAVAFAASVPAAKAEPGAATGGSGFPATTPRRPGQRRASRA